MPEFADRYFEVDYRLVKVRPWQYPYAEGQVWANAKVTHAAKRMIEAAQQLEQENGKLLPVPVGGWPVFSAEVVGKSYAQRLSQIIQGGKSLTS
jgi:hypothetical protein